MKLPGEENNPPELADAPPAAEVQQTPLPEVTAPPVAVEDGAVAEAVKDAEKVQPVPEPQNGDTAPQPVAAAPKPAEPPPLPVAKPAKPEPEVAVAPETPAVTAPKPGSVVQVGNKRVPVPRLKPSCSNSHAAKSGDCATAELGGYVQRRARAGYGRHDQASRQHDQHDRFCAQPRPVAKRVLGVGT